MIGGLDHRWFVEILLAVRITVGVGVLSAALGLLLGVGGAICIRSRAKAARLAAGTLGMLVRGVPELLTVLIVYYGTQGLANGVSAWAGMPTLNVNPFAGGVIALALVYGAYAMVIIAGALDGVGPGQAEAARSLGLPTFKCLILVLLPQAARLAAPGLGNLWLVLIKETSLVSAIALDEIMRTTEMVVIVTRNPFVFWSFALVLYLAITAASGAVPRLLRLGRPRAHA